MKLGRIKKLSLLGALLCLMLVFATNAVADATSGAIFLNSDVNSPSYLVLTFSDGSTQTLDTKFGNINTCTGTGCPSGDPAVNQGWWSNVDGQAANDNPNYRAGFSTSGWTYRDFFTFDLNQATAPTGGVTLEHAYLEVQRYDSLMSASGYIGYSIGVVTGISATSLNDKSNFGNLSYEEIALASDSTLFKVATSGDPTDTLSFDITSVIGDISLGSTASHNYFSLGGTTSNIDATSGAPEPTVIPTAVPEPASLLLMASGLSGAFLRRRKK